MKLLMLAFETKSPEWVSSARAEYVQKISHFVALDWKALKSPIADRDDAGVKQKKEAQILLKQIDPSDMVILFDEGGVSFTNSIGFAEHLKRVVESGKARVVFVIGGPYGFHEDIKRRANLKWSLSKLTFNHWVAQIASLEQIYRGFTIIRGLPYHN